MQRTASTDSLLSRATEESGDAGNETHEFTLRDEGVAACSSAAVAPPHAVACGSQDHEVKGHIGVYQGNRGGEADRYVVVYSGSCDSSGRSEGDRRAYTVVPSGRYGAGPEGEGASTAV